MPSDSERQPHWRIYRDRPITTTGSYPWVVECPRLLQTAPYRRARHRQYCERCDVFPSHASALEYVREQIRWARSFRRAVAVL